MPESSATTSANFSSANGVSHLLQCCSVFIGEPNNAYYADENRHVLKVGEMIDAWMALHYGNQVSDQACDTNHVCTAMQAIHATAEKRRLELSSIDADKAPPFDDADHFVIFMGYGMEAVRSRLARWFQGLEGSIPADAFRPNFETESTVHVELGQKLAQVLVAADASRMLTRPGLQTSLLWELQQGLSRLDNDGPGSIGNKALCLLSFPSLKFDIQEMSDESTPCVADQSAVYVRLCPWICLCPWISAAPPTASCVCKRHSPPCFGDINIRPVGGPQHCEVNAKTSRNGLKLSVAISVRLLGEEPRFQWRWWRNAFLGRLLGAKEWREIHNIPSPELHLMTGVMNQELKTMSTRTEENFKFWPGWRPFRFGFSLFELDGLQKHTQSTESDLGPSFEQVSASIKLVEEALTTDQS